MRQANGNRTGLVEGRRPARKLSHNPLMLQKKDLEPKLEVLSPDGYSGGKGEPPD
jgi:hypothetical protein